MPQIPEDLLKAIIQMTGLSQSEAEKVINKSLAEMLSTSAGNPQKTAKSKKTGSSPKTAKKPRYTQEKYPHNLPADNVKKYTLRITLQDIKPAIWRKIEVPSNITLRHLGDLILDLMGWDNYHLNQFCKGNDCYLPFYQREASGEDDFFWDCNNYNQEDYTIADLLQKKAQTVTFEYDFGDSWEHDVRLSSIDEYAPDEPHQITFIGGKGACPPEDCGGTWGYEELLSALDKRKAGKRLNTDEKESLEWAGWDKDYDPEYLSYELCRLIVEHYNN